MMWLYKLVSHNKINKKKKINIRIFLFKISVIVWQGLQVFSIQTLKKSSACFEAKIKVRQVILMVKVRLSF